ncbi:MAG: methyltransferase domain-containing protein [Pseudomonadota bacterium]
MAEAVRRFRGGDSKAAVAQMRKALKLAPAHADGWNNLGVMLSHGGDMLGALSAFQKALECAPTHLEAARNGAAAALELGQARAAVAPLSRAVELAPEDITLRTHLCQALADTGALEVAVTHALRLSHTVPDDPQYHAALGSLYAQLGRHGEAMAPLRRARALAPRDADVIRDLAVCLERARFVVFDADAATELEFLLAEPGVDAQKLAVPAGELLAHRYAIGARHWPDLDAALQAGFATDALAVGLLRRAVNLNHALERMLIAHRETLRSRLIQHGELSASERGYAVTLALQAFWNEHVWKREADAANDPHSESVSTGLAGQPDAVSLDRLLVLALFEPLHRRSDAEYLAAWDGWPEEARQLRETVLTEPLAERALVASMRSATIVDDTSVAVRAQYEESPYPRWSVLGEPVREPVTEMLQRLYRSYDIARAPANRDTLIAGCGSGHHALLVARRDPSANVVAIDLSMASLAHAMRRAEAFGVRNVEFRHLDILDAGSLGRRFGVVESFGVLHHMRDPAAGLAALRPLILDGGVLKLGLYSVKARQTVNLARARIAELGLGLGPDDVRKLRARILAGLEPDLESLFESSDFYATSACRDLLFHVQEHQFTAPDAVAFVEAQNLRFLGFNFFNDTIPNRYRDRFPDDPERLNAENWDRLEDEFPNTFSRCYQFWAQA